MPHAKVKLAPSQTKKSAPRLTPKQLRRLADRLVATHDPAEAERLKKEMECGFYGDLAHA